VAYIYEDLHRARSIVPPHDVLAKPALTRWDVTRPLSVENSVVLSHTDIARLDAAGGVGENVAWWNGKAGDPNAVPGNVVTDIVRRRQAEARDHIARM
jgi:hypothetical protein